MKRIYKGHEIDCHRARAMGGWDNLYYSVFRLSDMYEVTSGFTTGSDRVVDYVKYMKERIDTYIIDPSEEFPDDNEEQIEYHRHEIAKSMKGTRWGVMDYHEFIYGGYELGSGGPIWCKTCGKDKDDKVHKKP